MSDRSRDKRKSSGGMAWMVTYSDLVTLLLVFFILLISMSTIDEIKFTQAAGSLRGAFGVFEQVGDDHIQESQLETLSTIQHETVQRVYERIRLQMQRIEITEDIDLVEDRGAVILRVNESLLFDSGETSLHPEAHSVLEEVAELVRPWPLDLRIEGHTDDVPVATEGVTNWDISAERALSVLKHKADNELLPLDRLSAVGYGEQHPVAPNDSPENRAKNRRVDFVLESSSGYQEELPHLIDTRHQLPF